MLKTIFLRSLLKNTKKNKKKLKFFADTAIFLIIAALISSGISIYFESKFSTYKNELTKLELEEFTVQEWLTDAPSRNLEFKVGKFNYDLIEDNKKFILGKTRYYFYLLTWYPPTINYALEDMKIINNQYLNDKYKLNKIIDDNKNTLDFIYKIQKKLPEKHDEFTERDEINLKEKIFKTVSFNEIKDYLNLSEYNTLQINLYFQEYNNIIDQNKKDLRKLIIETTKKSNNAILYAFIFQLLIFGIVQFFELKELA
tara:strand:- start:762 stop:1529 length:768 start_codon:yes stop_codon:yes gene_type:complete